MSDPEALKGLSQIDKKCGSMMSDPEGLKGQSQIDWSLGIMMSDPEALKGLSQIDKKCDMIVRLSLMRKTIIISSPEPLGSQGELIGWP